MKAGTARWASRLIGLVMLFGFVLVLRVMEKVTGLGFLEDVSEFLLAFEGMSEGFRQRAASSAIERITSAARLQASS